MLELSLASSIAPDMQAERVDNIAGLQNPVKRLGAEALHKLAIDRPKQATRLMQAVLRPHGLEYLGFGIEASVYKTGDEVVKVHRRSVQMSEARRHRVAEEKQAQFTDFRPFYGGFLLDQVITVDTHPLGRDLRAVQTRQPFFSFVHNLGIFTLNNPSVNIDNLERVCRQYPGIADELTDFVEAARRGAAETGLLPDVNGTDNLVVSSDSNVPELKLIDSQPLPADQGWAEELINAQLDSLQNGLREIA